MEDDERQITDDDSSPKETLEGGFPEVFGQSPTEERQFTLNAEDDLEENSTIIVDGSRKP